MSAFHSSLTVAALLGAVVSAPLPAILDVTTGDLPQTSPVAVEIRKGEVAPGGATIWHTHPSPPFVYVESGIGTWEYKDGRPPETRGPGQAIEEPANVVMRITNGGGSPLKLVIFQVSKPGDPVLVPDGSGSPHPSAAQQVLSEEQVWLHAFATHDVATLGRVLAPEFVHIDYAGKVRNRGDELQMASSPARYEEHLSDESVSFDGPVAIVHGLNRVTQNGREVVELRFTDVFVRAADAWQALSAQETPVMSPPPEGPRGGQNA
jgi:quercetin dioxygenase-like cupin family protein/ketosteroid isomerase-like protein